MTSSPLKRRGIAIVFPVAAGFALFLALDLLLPFPFERLERAPAVIVTDRTGSPLRVFLPPDGRLRLPARLAGVSREMRESVVTIEDRWFRMHPGINPLSIARAAIQNVGEGRIVSGASTIPMQVARMAEPKERTIGSKIREAFRAMQLEWHLSKDEILEIYLNHAPYGGNIEGVGAAAFVYFGKEPSALSAGEAALLTALPRSPAALDPVKHPGAAREARDDVIRRLRAEGAFPVRTAADDALAEPLPAARRRAPFFAPHFAEMAASLGRGESRIGTTLDSRVQGLVEMQIAARIPALRAAGIGNAAAVVIENDGRGIRAMAGSAGFHETRFAGQVNGATAPRSPGSALKPFLYAAAIDDGWIVPDSILFDIPTDFAGYVAENFDGRYRGEVTVRDALVHSLNAPAVRLLSRVGLGDFLSLLKRGGLRTLDRPASAYGLPLILGSGEVTLLDLTNLYATLAEGGLHRPWRILAASDGSSRMNGRESRGGGDGGESAVSERLFSREAAHLVTGILSSLQRPDLPAAWDLTRDVPAVAWKTGTSYGHRDAWAVGFSSRYSIGVWVGNPDGSGRKGISGAEHAAPILFDLFRAVEGAGARLPDPLLTNLETIELCSVSHELPGPDCPGRIRADYLPGRTRLPACSRHRRIFVDTGNGSLLAGDCLASRPHRPVVVEMPPAELAAFRLSAGEQVLSLPPLSPLCGDVPADEPPRIVSPAASTPYRLRRNAPARFQQLTLTARASPSAEKLYWFQDGVLVASGAPGETLFLPPSPGRHRLVVVDAAGRTDGITYLVE